MPIANISLNIFASIIVLLVLISSFIERVKKETSSSIFLFLLFTIILTLAADTVGWLGEGKPELAWLNMIGNTLASCFAYLVLILFLNYFRSELYERNGVINAVIILLSLVCMGCMGIFLYNGLSENIISFVDEHGHFQHKEGAISVVVMLVLPSICFVCATCMTFLTKRLNTYGKFIYTIYGIVPIAGAIIDYFFHGYSFTYLSFVICAVIIYVNIYQQKRRIISE